MDTDTTVAEKEKILYETKSVSNKREKSVNNLTPSKIEFQLHKKSNKRIYSYILNAKNKKKKSQRQHFECETCKNIRKAIHPIHHGCAKYLKTQGCPPYKSHVISERAAERATKFWAEFFSSIHIGVAFFVTFLLQSYRIILQSIVNNLLVGLLHMTSEYLLEPLLTVIFNGFLQPTLIFCFNILTSIRDILEPVADTINNFVKPIATVGRSLRLIHITYNKKNITKNV